MDMNMKKNIRELFSGENGRISSKRVCGAITLFFALALTVYIAITDKDMNVLMFPYTTAGGLLGIGVFETFTKKKGEGR